MRGTVAQERWVWHRLDRNGSFVADISQYVARNPVPEVQHDTTRAVKRSLTCKIRADAGLDWLNDLVRVRYELRMPDGGWVDWVLGTFTLQVPDKDISPAVTWRNVQGNDLKQFLVDGSLINTYSIPTGTSVLRGILTTTQGYTLSNPANGQPYVNIPDPGAAVPAGMVWQGGETRLKVVNDLLASVVYDELWCDELGMLRSEPQPDYTVVQPSFTFDTTQTPHIVMQSMAEKVDLTTAYNTVRVEVQDNRRAVIATTYINANPESPTSTVNWRTKSTVIRDSRILTTAYANLAAQRAAQRYARIFAQLTVQTFPWPVSQNLDVYGLVYQTPDEGTVNRTYVEIGWTHRCGPGQRTDHVLQRVVPV